MLKSSQIVITSTSKRDFILRRDYQMRIAQSKQIREGAMQKVNDTQGGFKDAPPLQRCRTHLKSAENHSSLSTQCEKMFLWVTAALLIYCIARMIYKANV